MSIDCNHRDRYEPSPETADRPSKLAWSTLALGLGCWFVLPVVGAVAAVLTGFLERRKMAEGTSAPQGRIPVTIGLVAAVAQLIVGVLATIVAFLFAIFAGLATLVV